MTLKDRALEAARKAQDSECSCDNGYAGYNKHDCDTCLAAAMLDFLARTVDASGVDHTEACPACALVREAESAARELRGK